MRMNRYFKKSSKVAKIETFVCKCKLGDWWAVSLKFLPRGVRYMQSFYQKWYFVLQIIFLFFSSTFFFMFFKIKININIFPNSWYIEHPLVWSPNHAPPPHILLLPLPSSHFYPLHPSNSPILIQPTIGILVGIGIQWLDVESPYLRPPRSYHNL